MTARDESSDGTPEALPPSPWATEAKPGSRHTYCRGQFQKGGSSRALNQKREETGKKGREERSERREMGWGEGRTHHQV